MKLVVGFITYNENSAPYLSEFLPSLETALTPFSLDDYQVYALDNSSAGETANGRYIQEYNAGLTGSGRPRRPLEYLRYGQNLGFSRGYNILISLAQSLGAEYFLVINPDTILDPAAISRLADALSGDGQLGSVAPKLLRWDREGGRLTATIDSLGLILRPGLNFIDAGQGEEDINVTPPRRILGPSGAAGLYRLSALEKIKDAPAANPPGVAGTSGQYFDERFFMYKEDCDLAYRLFLAGYGSRLVSTAFIYHDRTAAAPGRGLMASLRSRAGKSRSVRAWSFHNQQLLFLKHWKNQNYVNKIIIVFRSLSMLIFSLIFEQFLLKEYFSARRNYRELTNIK